MSISMERDGNKRFDTDPSVPPNVDQARVDQHNVDQERSLGEKHPGATFSLMTFTYPLMAIVAIFVMAIIFWIW